MTGIYSFIYLIKYKLLLFDVVSMPILIAKQRMCLRSFVRFFPLVVCPRKHIVDRLEVTSRQFDCV